MAGATYGTAKKGGPRIKDQGKIILQTKCKPGERFKLLHTRKADVKAALMSVADMVDKGKPASLGRAKDCTPGAHPHLPRPPLYKYTFHYPPIL